MTPMLRQYLELKQQAGDALLLYRMGDFYELFFEDAQVAAPVLGVTLTSRRHNDEVQAPMCGVPHHAFDGYLGKLLEAGFRVAVAEQVGGPRRRQKGLWNARSCASIPRGRCPTPSCCRSGKRCYLVAIGGGGGDDYAVAWLEVSSGLFEGMVCVDPAQRAGAAVPAAATRSAGVRRVG